MKNTSQTLMNYLIEINRFYDWLETNQASDSAILLWHALMHTNNKCGWKKEFVVAISTIQNKTGLSKSSIQRARNQLEQLGRIKWKSRNGQQSAIYSMIAIHTEPQRGSQSEPQSEPQSGSQSEPQSEPITKLKETKLKETKLHPSSGDKAPAKKKKKDPALYWQAFVDVFDSFYQKKLGSKYNFMQKDWGHLRQIYDFMKKRATEKGWEFTEKTLTEGFSWFLEKAWTKDPWMKQNFSITNILSQFNAIANGEQATSKSKQPPTGANTSASSMLSKLAAMPD